MEDEFLDGHMEDMLSGGGRYAEDEPHWSEDVNEPEPDFEPDDAMDGDHGSALASAGFGTDEDYGSFGGEDDFLDGSYEE